MHLHTAYSQVKLSRIQHLSIQHKTRSCIVYTTLSYCLLLRSMCTFSFHLIQMSYVFIILLLYKKPNVHHVQPYFSFSVWDMRFRSVNYEHSLRLYLYTKKYFSKEIVENSWMQRSNMFHSDCFPEQSDAILKNKLVKNKRVIWELHFDENEGR